MEDYAAEAERVMKALKERDERHEGRLVTTSQLRRFLTAVNNISGKLMRWRNETGGQEQELPESLAAEISYLWVKLAYQIGRAGPADERRNPVFAFAKEAGLEKKIKAVGREAAKYEGFASYMEALVAFHKFYGGRD